MWYIYVLWLVVGDDVCLFDGLGYEFCVWFDVINKCDVIVSFVDVIQFDIEVCYVIIFV